VAEGQVQHLGIAGDEDSEWSLVEVRIGETIGFVPSLRCFPRAWEGHPPAWSGGGEMRSVRVESVAFSSRFDASVDRTQEDNWLLQLLSPEFVAWLTERPQEHFGFELHEGVLRCFSPGHLDGEAAERLVAESARVAERVRSEALESEGLGVRELGSGIPERIERAVAKVGFDAPPPDSAVASRPFRRFAARDPRVYLAALGGVVSGFGLLLWLLFEIGIDAIDTIVAIVGWIGPKNTGIGLAVFAVLAWLAAIPKAITIASHAYGRIAFAREYAAARGYSLESPQSFHRRVMRVDLPAPAQVVMRGSVAGRHEGRLVLCRSARRVFSSYADAAVFDVGEHEDGIGSGDGLDIAVDAGHLVVSRTSGGDRGAADLDRFAEKAVVLVERLERGELKLHQLNVAEGQLQETGS
jgi:hypothetical protein